MSIQIGRKPTIGQAAAAVAITLFTAPILAGMVNGIATYDWSAPVPTEVVEAAPAVTIEECNSALDEYRQAEADWLKDHNAYVQENGAPAGWRWSPWKDSIDHTKQAERLDATSALCSAEYESAGGYRWTP